MTITNQYVKICPLKQTLTHTRFHLSLRTTIPEVKYHRLLLFRINRPESSSSEFSHDHQQEGVEIEAGPSKVVAPSKEMYELYCMEEACPHLGAPLSHAELEDMEDSIAIVCPWHQYDFDLRDGSSSTGLNACVYNVQVRDNDIGKPEVWVEAPHDDAFSGERHWELIEMRGVSEEFADPPLPDISDLSLLHPSSCPTPPIPNSLLDTKPSLPTELPSTLLSFAHLILRTPNPDLKCLLTREAVSQLRSGKLKSIRPSISEIKRERGKEGGLLDQPPREGKYVEPGKIGRKGKGGTEKSRILMLHALANIEQYAIDLAWDIIVRFADLEVEGQRLPIEFFLDWAKVAEDEAKHFTLLAKRLKELGSYYGAHAVHASLWNSALETAHSLSARIAIIHLVAEARGVDMNPLTMAKLQAAGDKESTRILEIIHADEITHVTTGHRWFTWLCQQNHVDPITTFRAEVAANFHGKVKGPFNDADRLKAGLTPAYYEDLVGHMGSKVDVEKAEGDEHLHPRLI